VAFLAFLGALVAIVVVAIVVNRVRGATAHYLDAWTPEPGEDRLVEDPAADFAVVGTMGQAKKMSFARLRRTHAVMTSTRIVIATRALASRRYMITHMVHLAGDESPPEELGKLDGGLTTTGYVVIAAHPSGMTLEKDGDKRYVRIVPEPTASAKMIEHCRLYSDNAAGFLDMARSL
jgi:hypothetical protein